LSVIPLDTLDRHGKAATALYEDFMARIFSRAAQNLMISFYNKSKVLIPSFLSLSDYPYLDSNNNALGREEVRCLQRALVSPDRETAIQAIQDFLHVRSTRRWSLPPRAMEWEEALEASAGVALYTEIKVLDGFGAKVPSEEERRIPKQGAEELLGERLERCADLGYLIPEFGFSVTGMAQAFLLDRFVPGWKKRYLEGENETFSSLLWERVEAGLP
jgi:hypothetical protein